MPTMEDNLLKHGMRRVLDRLAPLDEKREDLASEVRLYDSPHWPDFQKSLERKYIAVMDLLREENDAVMTKVYQHEARRIIEWLKRPEMALQELQDLNAELSKEKSALLSATGIRVKGVADLNGRGR